MVGQSTIHVIWIVSSMSGPHSWDAQLREGSASLNGPSLLLNHLNGHQNCKSPFRDHLL